MTRRVVVTGIGPVSSIGIGKTNFWNSVQEGKKYFRTVNFPDVDIEQYRSRICSPIDNFDLDEYIDVSKYLRRAGRATKYSILGSYLALEDAGYEVRLVNGKGGEGKPQYFSIDQIEPARAGVVFGQAVANKDIEYPEHIKFVQNRGPRRLNPFTLPQTNPNVGASTVAEWFYMKGMGLTIGTACASATHAIGVAALCVQAGIIDVAVTGGSDAAIDSYVFSGFDVMRALSKRNAEPEAASRPFDRDRDGFVVGEGAGIVLLEELEHAKKRGARIYAEILGWGFSQDAYHTIAPDPYGAAAITAVQNALEMAKVSTEEVEYINAHGTSTILNDPTESYIIKQVFGNYAYKIPISSSKSYFGHCIGAAGGLEAIVTLLVMENSTIAPTANLENPDSDYVDKITPQLDKRCDLDYVPKTKREKTVSIAMSESFGFGGQNGVLFFKKFEG